MADYINDGDMTMTRQEMLKDAYANRCNVYATEEMWQNGDYILVDHSGYLQYGNGEEILDEEELPEDGWIDFTDYRMELDDYSPNSDYILYDENDD